MEEIEFNRSEETGNMICPKCWHDSLGKFYMPYPKLYVQCNICEALYFIKENN